MADPLALAFDCGACGRSDTIEIEKLQLVGPTRWLRTTGFLAERKGERRVRCAECWDADPLAESSDVEDVSSAELLHGRTWGYGDVCKLHGRWLSKNEVAAGGCSWCNSEIEGRMF